MLSFQNAVAVIISTLKDFQRSEMVIRWYQAFYNTFLGFIIERGLMNDPVTAFSLWKEAYFGQISEHRREISSSAAKALLFVMQNARIPYDFFHTIPSKMRLSTAHYDALTEYLEHANHEFSPGHIPIIESRCSMFLFRAQVHGIQHISDLNYVFLQTFCDEYNYSLSMSKGMVASTIEGFLKYWADKAIIPQAFSLFLNKNRRASLIDISAMSSADQETLNCRRHPSNEDFPPDEFYTSSIVDAICSFKSRLHS